MSDKIDDDLKVLMSTKCIGFTEEEVRYFIKYAKSEGLNPYSGDCWINKDEDEKLIVFTGHTGFLKVAQTKTEYNGIRSSEVRKNDSIIIDIPEGLVEHRYSPMDDRGEVVGAWAKVFRKEGEPGLVYIDRETYDRLEGAWLSHAADMCMKVAESKAVKKAFGLGVQSEYEWKKENNVVIPITNEQETQILDEIKSGGSNTEGS